MLHEWRYQTSKGHTIGVAVAETLKHNARLQSFKLEVNDNIGDASGVALAEALKQNTTLQSFDLEVYRMSDAAGVAMAEALQHNATLQSFELKVFASPMGDAIGVSMAEALKKNTKLQCFKLAVNDNSCDASGVALAEALRHNVTLQSFDLQVNGKVGDASGIAIAEALQANATLQYFKLNASDDMGDATAVALAEALEHNSTLQSCEIWGEGNNMSDASINTLTNVLEHNVTLQYFTIPSGFDDSYAGDSWTSWTRYNANRYLTFQLQRNDAIRIQRHALTAVARCSCNTGYHCLSERNFRSKIFTFFLPARCKVKPVEFLDCRNADFLHPQSKRKRRTPSSSCNTSHTQRRQCIGMVIDS